MKLVLPFAALAFFAAAGAAVAAPDYTTICNSSKLVASDRHECRVQMTAATSEAQQAEIYRQYETKIADLATKR